MDKSFHFAPAIKCHEQLYIKGKSKLALEVDFAVSIPSHERKLIKKWIISSLFRIIIQIVVVVHRHQTLTYRDLTTKLNTGYPKRLVWSFALLLLVFKQKVFDIAFLFTRLRALQAFVLWPQFLHQILSVGLACHIINKLVARRDTRHVWMLKLWFVGKQVTHIVIVALSNTLSQVDSLNVLHRLFKRLCHTAL